MTFMNQPLIAVLAASALAPVFATGTRVETSSGSEDWQHRVLIYGWFADIKGTLNYKIPGVSGSAGASASDLIDNLKGVFMGTYEGRMESLCISW